MTLYHFKSDLLICALFDAYDKVLKCDPTLQDKMNLYTLYKKDDSTLTRKLSCYEAIEAMDDYDIEVR